MKFEELLKLINGEPIFTSSLLLAGNISTSSIRKQLSNWKEIIALNIKKINWGEAADDTSPFLGRESEKYLLTLDNCLNLLYKF